MSLKEKVACMMIGVMISLLVSMIITVIIAAVSKDGIRFGSITILGFVAQGILFLVSLCYFIVLKCDVCGSPGVYVKGGVIWLLATFFFLISAALSIVSILKPETFGGEPEEPGAAAYISLVFTILMAISYTYDMAIVCCFICEQNKLDESPHPKEERKRKAKEDAEKAEKAPKEKKENREKERRSRSESGDKDKKRGSGLENKRGSQFENERPPPGGQGQRGSKGRPVREFSNDS